MPTLLRSVIASLLLIQLAACGTIKLGRNFDMDAFNSRIERGITTRDQVRGWLGDPIGSGVSVGSDGQRYDEWTYYFAQGKVSSLSAAKVKILQIKFDRNGIVRAYNWSASAP